MPDNNPGRLEYRDGGEDRREQRAERQAEREGCGRVVGILCVLVLFAVIAISVFLFVVMRGLH